MHAESRTLASDLATQTQARLNLSEKLDSAQAALRTAETELASTRARTTELEQRLSKDQRSLLTAENQYRDQLTERNTLLLTIYQYMDKILGVDKLSVSILSPARASSHLIMPSFRRRRARRARRSRTRTLACSTTI